MESASVVASQNTNNPTNKTFSKEIVKIIERLLSSKIGLAIGGVCLLVMFITVIGLVVFNAINQKGLKRDIFGNKYEYIANIDNKGYQVAFGEKAQGSAAILVSENDNEIKMTPLDSEGKAIKSIPRKLDDKTLLFKDVSDIYDVKYQVEEKGIKEEIILLSSENLNKFVVDGGVLKYRINLKGLEIQKDSEGNLLPQFKSLSRGEIYTIPAFYMYDAKGEESTEIKIEIEEVMTGEYIMTVRPSEEWLTNGERTFPIVIDPSIVKGAGPISFWEIDSTDTTSVADHSGSSNNLSITNAQLEVDSSVNVLRPGSTFYKFDGNGDYLSRAYDSDYDFGTGSFSLSLWLNIPVKATEDDYIILSRYNNAGYKIYLSSNSVCFGIDADATWTPTDSVCGVPIGNSTIKDANWHHVAAVKSGTSSITLYIDGAEIAQDTSITSSSLSGTSPILYLGIDNGGSNYAYFGSLDKISIYNYALTPEQVRTDSLILPQTSAVFGVDPLLDVNSGLVGHWKMDESSGDINDSTLNGMSLVNAASTAFSSGKFGNSADYERSSSQYHYAAVSGDIQYDAVGSGQSEQTTSISWSHNTTSSGSNVIMIVGVGYANGGNVNSVTYNGVNLTHLRTDKNGSSKSTSLWYLVNPSTGNNTVSVTLASSSNFSAGGSITLTGVDLTDPIDAQNGSTGSSTTASTSVTTNTNNAWLVDVAAAAGETTLAVAGGSQTQRWNVRVNSVPQAGGTFGPQTPAGAKSLSWTVSPSNAWAISAVALKPKIVDPSEHLKLTGSLSLSAWINPESNTAATQYDIVGKWDGSNESYLLAQYGDEIRLYIDSSSSYVTTNSVNLATGTWAHVLGVYDSVTGSITIYVNGVPVDTTVTGTIPNSIGQDSGAFQIGAEDSSSSASNFYDGKIDEVRVYNKALTPRLAKAVFQYVPGPVAYYDFNENTGTSSIYDKSGNGNTGNMNGSMTENDWVNGKFGSALNFDGSDDYIGVGNPTELTTIDSSHSWTISMWYKSNDNSSNYKNLLYMGGTTGGFLLRCGYRFGDNRCDFQSQEGAYPQTYSQNNSFVPYEWQHIAVTGSGTGSTIKIYINGLNVTSSFDSDFSWTSPGDAEGFRIGFGYASQNWNGFIDDLKVYNYARTPAQIIEDMNAGHPSPGSPVGSALLHYKFDEGVDNTCSGGTNDVCNWGSGGTTLDGSQNNMAVPATSTSGWTNNGEYGKAMNFDGSNDYVSVPKVASWDFGTNSFTLSSWFKTSLGTGLHNILRYDQSASGATWALRLDAGKVDFFIADTSRNVSQITTTGTYSDNTWHHAIGVRDSSSGTLKIYVDGNLIVTGSDGGRDVTGIAGTYLSIGRQGAGAYEYWSGSIDEVKIYSLALTADQVIAEFNAGKTTVMGSLSSESSAGARDQNSEARRFCVPGDSSTCNPPIAWYKFDEKTGTALNDSSSTGNSLTYAGTTGSQWVSGKTGSALKFNGSDNRAYAAGRLMSQTDNFTLEAWINPSVLNQTETGLVYNGNDPGGYGLMYGGVSGSGSKLYGLYGFITWIDSGYTFTEANRWYHVVMVRSSGTVNFYVDGVKTSGSSASNPNTPNNYFEIGHQPSSGSRYFNGKIDDVKVYNYARTPAQIAWDYNQGAPIAWYTFDECSGTSIGNWAESANGVPMGNNGTLNLGASGTTSAGTCTTSGAWFNGVSGKYNASMDFDGMDDYVSIGNVSELSFERTQPITVSAWIKPNVTRSGGAKSYSIVSKRESSGTALTGWTLYLGYGVWTPVTYLFFAESNNWSGGANLMIGGYVQDIPNDEWMHVSVSYSGNSNTSGLTFYINGKQEPTYSVFNSLSGSILNSASVSIGSVNNAADFFNGQIDDVRIYNYALTEEQINQAMNGGTAVSYQ